MSSKSSYRAFSQWSVIILRYFLFKVIESREMMDESKTPDTIDGAVRVAHLVKK